MKKKSVIEEVVQLKESTDLKNIEIAEKLNISINTVEKSLQLGRLHKELYKVLTQDRYDKLVSLKFKALDIKSIKDDEIAVIKFLDSINIGASAKEIKEKLSLIEIRQEKVKEIKSDISDINKCIEISKKEVKILEKQYKSMMKEIDTTFSFIVDDKTIPEDKKIELLQSIAYNKKYQRWQFVGYVDYSVYKYLINKNYIYIPINTCPMNRYDRNYEMTPVIEDIEKFIGYVKRSKTFSASFQTKFTRRHNLIWANNGDKELKEITDTKNELNEIKAELKKLKKELNTIVNSDLNDFETVLEAKNELAKKDILKHNEVSIRGMKWLKSQGYIADIEYTHGKYRFDVIGVHSQSREVIILETKVSLSDFKQDKKFGKYSEYCNKFYIITDNPDIVTEISKNHNIMGFVFVSGDDIWIGEECEVKNDISIDANEVMYNIYDRLWSRIYKL